MIIPTLSIPPCLGTTPGKMLKMQSNILVAQCLMIAQFVLILIGALKKAGNGAVEGVADRYYHEVTLHLEQIYRGLYPTHTDIIAVFIGQR